MLEQLGIDEAELRRMMIEGDQLAEGVPNEEAADKAISIIKGEMQLKDVKGLTDDEMEATYANGFNMFQAGNYKKASQIFEFLVMFDNGEKKYWTALGATMFNLRNYNGALTAYSSAVLIDVDPKLLVKIAQCHLALDAKEIASGALEAAIELAGEDEEHAQTKVQAQALFDLLNGDD